MGFTVVDPADIDNTYLELSQNEGFDLVVITAPSNQVQSNAMKYAKRAVMYPSLPVFLLGMSLSILTAELFIIMNLLRTASDSTVEHVKEAVSMLEIIRSLQTSYNP